MTAPSRDHLGRLHTPEDVAKALGTTTRALRRWRDEGRGPKWVKVGRSPRYVWSDVLAWLSANRGT